MASEACAAACGTWRCVDAPDGADPPIPPQDKLAFAEGGKTAAHREAEEKAQREMEEMAAKAEKLELEMAKREAHARMLEEKQDQQRKEMEERMAEREAILRKEEEQKHAMKAESSKAEQAKYKAELERLKADREAQDKAIKQSQARVIAPCVIALRVVVMARDGVGI